ncbi:hypothetical protein, partial [Streptomyces sp. NPDC001978]|uniref:hypothetical protein n=1 Tax=Streptomyces sp. NPDC001978 TaxID=3364627 RepID=UPI00369F19F6
MRDADGRPASAGASQDTEAELARLRAENARLAKAEKEWQLEREILRRAAAYFGLSCRISSFAVQAAAEAHARWTSRISAAVGGWARRGL